ncbi:MAG TPA: BON domain-containing protein [Bdellovibrionota bacterium]|nr:BON domain-containing protein [Bdellovibrionota bacterium]
MKQVPGTFNRLDRFRWMALRVGFFALLLALPSIAADPTDPSAGGSGVSSGKRKYSRSKLTHDESEYLADKRRLVLSTGEDKAVDLDFEANGGAGGVNIGNPQVVATTFVKIGDKRQIVFKPLKAGDSTVTIRDVDGTLRVIFKVKVTSSDLLRIAGEIRDLLRDVEGLNIRIVGARVIMEGEVLVPADYTRVITVIGDESYAKSVINLVTLSPLALQVVAKRIKDDINAFAQNVTTRVVNGVIFLEGTVDNPDHSRRAAQIAYMYLPDPRPGDPMLKLDTAAQKTVRNPIQNFIVISAPPAKKQEKLVRVTAHFVELSKDYNRLFGFKWQPGISSGGDQITVGSSQTGAAGGSGGTFSATISSLIPKLQSAQNAGYARILRTSTVIVRSGQPAKLSEKTNFPYAIQGSGGQLAAGNSEVGLGMAVTPLILGQSEDIQLDLSLDQSALVGGAPASGAPPITAAQKVETKLYIKSNESAAIAGITASDIGTDFNKDDPSPGSFEGNTDPLFTLLRSKRFRKKKSQFVIFVTPQIIDNASEGSEDLKKNFRIKVR